MVMSSGLTCVHRSVSAVFLYFKASFLHLGSCVLSNEARSRACAIVEPDSPLKLSQHLLGCSEAGRPAGGSAAD